MTNFFFDDSTMWCESKNPHVQRACKISASEEVKQVVCIIVLTVVIVKILDWLKYPVRKAFNWIKMKVNNLKRGKRPIPSVPRPCILKVDYDAKLDIDKWINQARMYVEPLEENRRAEMLMMLVEETERKSLESHCQVDRAMNPEEHLEHLLKVIKSMHKKKSSTPTQNMEKFMRRKKNEDERIPDYASDLKETLYRAWPGQPKIKLEELLVTYFIHGIYNSDTKAKLKFEGPTWLVKAMEIAQIYEDVLNNNSSIVKNTDFTTPPTFSFIQIT